MSKTIDHIVVDLDGTLIRTDLFFEGVLTLIKRNPFNVLLLGLWILRGRSVAKERVAQLVEVDAQHLPYEPALVDYLREQKKQGRRLLLATASHRTYANKVAAHLGFFNQGIASDSKNNLKGRKKLAAIRQCIGGAAFAYAGDSPADRLIWKEAAANIFVNAPNRDVKEAEAQGKAEKIISSNRSIGRAFLKEMRFHQWTKNILVFVPLFTSHGYLELAALLTAALAFICFSLCASGAYFLNDLLDLPADRCHASKRFRPLASGDLPIVTGFVGAMGLPFIAFTMAGVLLPVAFIGILAFYFLITTAYSFVLKRISTADVMTLAVLYTLRVVAGCAAVDIELSSWLMAFSIFVFVSLAYLKRYIEISTLTRDTEKSHGRGYSAADSETVFSLGIANITTSVLVLALYISSEEIIGLYQSPEILWLLCLLMLYWGNRIWIGARRGKITDDPVVFAIKDNVSRMVGVAFLVVVLAAKFIKI